MRRSASEGVLNGARSVCPTTEARLKRVVGPGDWNGGMPRQESKFVHVERGNSAEKLQPRNINISFNGCDRVYILC